MLKANYDPQLAIDLRAPIQNMIDGENIILEKIVKALLNKYGYPNNIEMMVHQNTRLRVWVLNGIEIARMQTDRKIDQNCLNCEIKYAVA